MPVGAGAFERDQEIERGVSQELIGAAVPGVGPALVNQVDNIA